MTDQAETPDATDALERAQSFVSRTLELAGFDVEVSAEQGDDGFLLDISGNDAELVVKAANGSVNTAVLEALAALARRATFTDRNVAKNITVDAADFRGNRLELLAGLADTVAEKASQGMEIDVFGMDSVDRKAVHRHLAARDEVSTASVGNGIFRRLTVRGQ